MAQIRTLITEDSVWRFNLDTMMYRRTPRSENSTGSEIPYTFEWEPFEALETSERDNRFIVHRPVPWGTGARRLTGVVLENFLSVTTASGDELRFEREELTGSPPKLP